MSKKIQTNILKIENLLNAINEAKRQEAVNLNSLGENNIDGIRKSLYEPVHGSAPDITGQGKANPIAMILSFAMMLRYSLDRNQDAELVEKAVDLVLQEGFRTEDIMQPGKKLVSTEKMGIEIFPGFPASEILYMYNCSQYEYFS